MEDVHHGHLENVNSKYFLYVRGDVGARMRKLTSRS